MSRFLVISSSLNPDSRSRMLCKAAFDLLATDQDAKFIDLMELQPPLCDGGAAYGHTAAQQLNKQISEAACVLLGTPVYNYYASASAKNMIELTGRAWSNKLVGFLCAAGGRSSYMAVMSLANSLMLDFRCLVIPRFVYAQGEMFDAKGITDSDLSKRVEDLVTTAVRITDSLQSS